MTMRFGFVVLAGLLLGGCALAPGMKMDETRYPISGGVSEKGEQLPDIRVQPINAELLTQEIQKRTRPMPRSNEPLQKELSAYQYRVGPRDVLRITVWDHPELIAPTVPGRVNDPTAGAANNEVTGQVVSADGNVYVPYVGLVQVGGKTIEEVRTLLTQALSRYIQKPQLDVRVVSFRSQLVQVAGEVTKPGPVPVSDTPVTVVDAVGLAGGAKPEADLTHVTVTRRGQIVQLDLQSLYDFGDTTHNRLLHDGDIVHIPDRNRSKVFVLGEVTKPLSQPMIKGRLTLAEAIGDAGGVNQETSNPSRIYVIRGDINRPDIYRLDAGSPDAMLLATQFQLQPFDVVYVSTAEVTRWGRMINQLLPSITAMRTLQLLQQ
jgi:polysaccharide export outer membrane protein